MLSLLVQSTSEGFVKENPKYVLIMKMYPNIIQII